MIFEIGDKVRLKNNHNLIGTISEISFDFRRYGHVDLIVTVTIDYQTEIQIDACNIEKINEEKETNNMRKFKIGDIVVHWIFGKGTVVGYEKYSNITVKFEDFSTRVMHEDTCHLVSRGREFHDLCGRRPMPKFKQVIYNDPATIIFWEDGTKTVVKCDGEKYDELKGLMMGIVKKVYGLKKFYDIYENTIKYVTGNKTLLNIEKGLAESVVKDLYGIKKIDSIDDIYKGVLMKSECEQEIKLKCKVCGCIYIPTQNCEPSPTPKYCPECGRRMINWKEIMI